MISIWNRYLLKMFLNCFILCIASFYFLYIIIDYSSHPDKFYFDHYFQWKNFFLYYICDSLRRFNVLAPFAILVSTIKVVSQLVVNHEFLAMMVSGATVKRLLRPLMGFSLLMTLLIFLNLEFITPFTLKTINRINDAHKNGKRRHRELPIVKQILLKDDTIFLFQTYDPVQMLFFDAYWIVNIDEVYHMKTLYFLQKAPLGAFVDLLQRNQLGEMVRTNSWKEKAFPEMKISKKSLREIITPPEEQPISKLWKKRPIEKHAYTDKEAQILSALYYKVTFPWLCLVALIAPIPFCIQFTRRLPVYMIYACSLFGLVALMIILNSAFILGKRQVLDPFFVTWIPFISIIGYFSFRYYRV